MAENSHENEPHLEGYERLPEQKSDDVNDTVNLPKTISSDISDVLKATSESKSIRISLSQDQICKSTAKDANPIVLGALKKTRSGSQFKNLSIYPKSISIDVKSVKKSENETNDKRINSSKSLHSSFRMDGSYKQSNLSNSESNRIKVDSEKPSIQRKFTISGLSKSSKSYSTISSKPLTVQSIASASGKDNRIILDKIPIVEPKPFSQEKFKCNYCKKFFRDPRVLDCLHTFCLQCIEDMEAVQANVKSGDNSEGDLSGTKSDSTIPNSISTASFPESEHQSRRMSVGKFSLKDRKNSIRSARVRNSSSASYIEKSKSIQCSICSFITEIAMGGCTRLPQNFIIVRYMVKAQILTNESDSTWCDLCYNDNLAIAYCLQCNVNLCSVCKEAHIRQKTTSLHDVSYLKDLKSPLSDDRNQRNKAQKCTIHTSFDLKLFCATCYQVICTNCTILLHKNHKYEPIIRASKIYSKLVKDNLERTRPLSNFAIDSISKLNRISKKMIEKAETVQNEVETFLDQYTEALNVHRQILLKQIARARETKMQSITDQQTDLEKRSIESKTAINFTEELLTEGTDLEILMFSGMILRRFEHCQRSKGPLDPNISDCLEFLPEIKAPSTQGQHNIPMYGIIATQVAIPKLCTMETDSLMFLRVHRKTELCLTTKDIDNRSICHGGLTISAVLTYKDASLRVVPTEISDHRDGTYIISFQPDAAGMLTLSVTIQDKHIKGSPFTLCARSLRPHSGIFHCCTFCSSKASKSATCACSGTMPGPYKGCGHGHEGHPGRRHWSCCGSDLESSECSATNTFR